MIINVLILLITLIYLGVILAFYIGLIKVFAQKPKQNVQLFSISVIVAFKDEASNLSLLLEAIIDQSFPKDRFELILVNDHSTDESLSIVDQYCSILSNLRLVNLPDSKSGKKAAIAFGIESAKNPLIAITDADCKPSKRWLEEISLEAGNDSILILGSVVMVPINSFAQKLQSLEYSSLMATLVGSCGIGHPIIASSANISFRNDFLNVSEKTLNPAISSGDDMFILHHAKRIMKGNISFLNSREAIVQTATASTLSNALDQRKRWASKSIHYNDLETIVVGFVILLFNLLIVSMLISSFFNLTFLFYSLVLYLVKSFIDFILVSRYLKFTQQAELLKVFLPLQLVYPFYIVYTFFSGVLTKRSWKGRPIK